MRSVILLISMFPLLLLSGCSTPQERAVHKQAEVEQMMVVYGPACSRLGYTANSDPWRHCIIQLSTRDDLQRYGAYPGYYSVWGPEPWHGGWWGRW